MKIVSASHIPRLIAMVAKDSMCERNVSNFIYLHLDQMLPDGCKQ